MVVVVDFETVYSSAIFHSIPLFRNLETVSLQNLIPFLQTETRNEEIVVAAIAAGFEE